MAVGAAEGDLDTQRTWLRRVMALHDERGTAIFGTGSRCCAIASNDVYQNGGSI